MPGTPFHRTLSLSRLHSETKSKIRVSYADDNCTHMEPKSTKFLEQAFASGDDTRIAVHATRKHDTPINCILGVSPIYGLAF